LCLHGPKQERFDSDVESLLLFQRQNKLALLKLLTGFNKLAGGQLFEEETNVFVFKLVSSPNKLYWDKLLKF